MFAGAAIIIAIAKNSFFENPLDKLSNSKTSSSYLESMTRDETFDWINNEFLGDDKKDDREIVDERGNTRHQMLSINTSDGTDYVYRAIKAPYKSSEEYALYIVVDCMTNTVLMDDNVQKKTQIKGDMFETCPEVKRMRKLNGSQGVTTQQLKQQAQQMAGMQMMPGMYGGMQNQSNQQNQPQNNADNSDDGVDGGDE